MPARIRLQRHGKKGRPFYHIVIADGRAPRDGRFIEKIGTYNPTTNPAEIILDFDKALTWLQNGAQPSDTARAILSYKGVIYKSHLLKGVKKGALTEEQAEVKFQNWLREKEEKIEAKRRGLTEAERVERKKALDEEAKVNEARAAELAKKRAVELKAEKDAAAEKAAESATEEIVVEEKTEVVAEETAEVVAEETKEAAEETKEVVAEETTKKTSAKDTKVDKTEA
jgi:small subunit ribosomal protein S16